MIRLELREYPKGTEVEIGMLTKNGAVMLMRDCEVLMQRLEEQARKYGDE